MDPILLIGHLGSIGSRYRAILNYLKVPWAGHDPLIHSLPPNLKDFRKAIVCSPTSTHYDWCRALIDEDIVFLCEKPLCLSLTEAEALEASCKPEKGFVSNNLLILAKRMGFKPGDKITYDFYKTGNDGTFMDCCQILYLDPKATIRKKSPIWDFRINMGGRERQIPYGELEMSYVTMLNAFANDTPGILAPLSVGVEMVLRAQQRMDAA